MDERDRLTELLKDTKEDAPISGRLFEKFLLNHFLHLSMKVSLNTKLLWIILAVILAAAVAVLLRA